MRLRSRILLLFAGAGLAACGSAPVVEQGTLAGLSELEPEIEDVQLEDGLEQAEQSYRRYLEETPESARTPEAMRRLADLQIEQEYGVLGKGGTEYVEMAAPESAAQTAKPMKSEATVAQPTDEDHESDAAFEERASQRQDFLATEAPDETLLTDASGQAIPAGPREAIKTYRTILEQYPNYERNDQVLYQLSRAYDEIGEPDAAMEVMNEFVREYPYSRYVDEVHFRRGEYYFVRKKFLDAEDAYKAVIRTGNTSSFFELALYKLGWALYKQEMYERRIAQLHGDARSPPVDRLRLRPARRGRRRTPRVGHVSRYQPELLEPRRPGGPRRVLRCQYGDRTYADKIYSNLGEFYFDEAAL